MPTSASSCSLLNKGIILLLSVVSIVGLSTAPQFLGVGICMFVSIFTLIVTSLNIGIIASDWHRDFTNVAIFQGILPGQQTQWHHLQFALSIALATFNFLSFILLATMAQMVLFGGNYFLPGVTTLVITFLYGLEACIALRIDLTEESAFGDDYEQIS
uniref:Uncharacterized protein n=1 Tax=Panagrolaimus sp. JU765 TaxID=591449 RepID=A0AC34RSC3_9BILA